MAAPRNVEVPVRDGSDRQTFMPPRLAQSALACRQRSNCQMPRALA